MGSPHATLTILLFKVAQSQPLPNNLFLDIWRPAEQP